ncbi:hypothetical protein F2P56_032000 [Juglans regia]|uniref:Endonuclease/exonuclease/phosphatase domain-containing protein n=1 Tax=Juglans regia TaxID=51240 RepID=A0A833X7S4_JUGRE|nr:hypothetical protein F2P56_032000 [Juglans regia]
MKLISWNCRGIACPCAIHSLWAIIRTHNLEALFLSETLLSSVNTATIVNRLGFSHHVYMPPSGKWGGLLFLWRMGLDVEIVNSASNIISVLIYSDPAHCPWMLNIIYCLAKFSKKLKFWDDLTAVTKSFLGPSVIIGDFNSILNQSEKFDGKPYASTSNPKDLKLFLEQTGFIDLRAFGTPHTWSNNKQGAHHIREKLDRAVINLHWNTLFPDASITYLPRSASDHSPIILETSKFGLKKNPSSLKSFGIETLRALIP